MHFPCAGRRPLAEVSNVALRNVTQQHITAELEGHHNRVGVVGIDGSSRRNRCVDPLPFSWREVRRWRQGAGGRPADDARHVEPHPSEEDVGTTQTKGHVRLDLIQATVVLHTPSGRGQRVMGRGEKHGSDQTQWVESMRTLTLHVGKAASASSGFVILASVRMASGMTQ